MAEFGNDIVSLYISLLNHKVYIAETSHGGLGNKWL